MKHGLCESFKPHFFVNFISSKNISKKRLVTLPVFPWSIQLNMLN